MPRQELTLDRSKFYSADGLREALQIGTDSFKQLRREGLPARRLDGRKLVFLGSEVADFIENRKKV